MGLPKAGAVSEPSAYRYTDPVRTEQYPQIPPREDETGGNMFLPAEEGRKAGITCWRKPGSRQRFWSAGDVCRGQQWGSIQVGI